MSVDDFVIQPGFNITRASHVELAVVDLQASKAFYTETIGLVVSDESDTTIYLRGLEETCHHSLTLQKAARPTCIRLGMRVLTEDDLDALVAHFESRQIPATFVEKPFQGRTLQLSDGIGTPLEFCAAMDRRPRLLGRYELYRGGAAQRLDHYQVAAQDVQRAYDFYQPLGFRCSEYTYSLNQDGSQQLWGVWLQRKRTTSFSRTELVHVCIISPTRSETRTTCCISAMSPALWVWGHGSNADRAGMAWVGAPSSSTFAIRMGIGSNFSIRTTRRLMLSRRLAGTCPIRAGRTSGGCRPASAGTSKPLNFLA
jgi:catechol 2,3-dioxygenase-like lactoylglutathione lyase family enzyme